MNTEANLSKKEKVAIDAGIRLGIKIFKELPKGSDLELESNITGVLIVFMSALWGSYGTEFARGFIEAQLRSMESDVPHEKFVPPNVH